jgi:ketosteroid isomerase-like protein
MNPRPVAVLLSAAVLLAGCSRSDSERYRDEIIAADKAFSASSEKEGAKAAFLRVIARDAKLLAIDTRTGAEAVTQAFLQLPPTAKLTWEPAFAEVSDSGELGYTWGRYQLVIPMTKPGQAPLIRRGTYVTVWKRLPGGQWKVVLDGGNQDGAH